MPTNHKETSPKEYIVNIEQPFAEQVSTLDKLTKEKPDKSYVLQIGPELAENIIQTRNLSNRPMKAGKIKQYAEDLKHGRWGLTGDTLKFASDGTLKDGQNRLAAVIRSKVPLITHAVFGVDPALFARMDIGKNRTPADVFHIAGLSYANHAAAAVRWLLILTSANPGNRGASFTNETLLRAYRERFDPVEIEHSVRQALEVKKAVGAPVGSVAALHYLFHKEDPDKADAFMQDWATGKGGPRAPTVVLQQKLRDLMVATNNRIHENVRNAMIIAAFDAYRKGKQLKKGDLDFDPEEPMPGPVETLTGMSAFAHATRRDNNDGHDGHGAIA